MKRTLMMLSMAMAGGCVAGPALSLQREGPTNSGVATAVIDDSAHLAVLQDLRRRRAATDSMAQAIWDESELGYLEFNTSRRMIAALREAGFTIQTGVGGMPTAFTATYGRDGPLIAVLAEMDALPGRSQAQASVQREMPGRANIQSCGHNLFAAGSVASAIAIRNWLERSGTRGRIRLYGTPAEEGGSGKVYLVRSGAFSDVDVVLHWHPSMLNAAAPVTNNAVLSARFRFQGVGTHAASSPERGRSALAAVQAMNLMVDMMRASIRDGARISYIITRGGDAPNVVPESAEVYYYVREADAERTRALFNRVVHAAQGAAVGTETQVTHEIIHGTYNLLPNQALARIMDRNLRIQAPTLAWTPEEQAFARQIQVGLQQPAMPLNSINTVYPFQLTHVTGSSDVGDVSWTVPTAGIVTLTWVPGVDAHTWQAAATGRMGIGLKGMHLASQVIAMTATDLYRDASLIAAARAEFADRRGRDFRYLPLIGDRAPPLQYRQNAGATAG